MRNAIIITATSVVTILVNYAVVNWEPDNWNLRILAYLAVLQPIGQIVQLFPELPKWPRWYLGDSGVVPCLVLLGAMVLRLATINSASLKLSYRLAILQWMTLGAIVVAWVSRYLGYPIIYMACIITAELLALMMMTLLPIPPGGLKFSRSTWLVIIGLSSCLAVGTEVAQRQDWIGGVWSRGDCLVYAVGTVLCLSFTIWRPLTSNR